METSRAEVQCGNGCETSVYLSFPDSMHSNGRPCLVKQCYNNSEAWNEHELGYIHDVS